MGLKDLLLNGTGKLGWNGGTVPSNKMSKVQPNPPGSRHETYSLDGNPNISMVGAGFVPPKPAPSSLDEGDVLNTAKFRNARGKKYTDNLPR
jgi:hypothetical protein